MEEGKVKVETFEGPVEYEFTNFPAVGTSPREESPPPPPKREKKKKKKKEKKRRRKPKRKPKNVYWFVIGPVCALAVLYFLLFPTPMPKRSHFTNLIITKRGHDTTALPMTHDDASVPTMLIEHMRRFANLPVLCMHHLKHGKPQTFQACAVQSNPDIVYYMVNPRIVKKMGKLVTVSENSIAKTEAQQKKRNRCVLAEWTDHKFNLTAHFCGDAAISLQMAIEEFNRK